MEAKEHSKELEVWKTYNTKANSYWNSIGLEMRLHKQGTYIERHMNNVGVR